MNGNMCFIEAGSRIYASERCVVINSGNGLLLQQQATTCANDDCWLKITCENMIIIKVPESDEQAHHMNLLLNKCFGSWQIE